MSEKVTNGDVNNDATGSKYASGSRTLVQPRRQEQYASRDKKAGNPKKLNEELARKLQLNTKSMPLSPAASRPSHGRKEKKMG